LTIKSTSHTLELQSPAYGSRPFDRPPTAEH